MCGNERIHIIVGWSCSAAARLYVQTIEAEVGGLSRSDESRSGYLLAPVRMAGAFRPTITLRLGPTGQPCHSAAETSRTAA